MRANERQKEMRVLVCSRSTERRSLHRELKKAGIRSSDVPEFTQLIRDISQGAGAIVVDLSSLTDRRAKRLLAALDRQPPWSDLPVIVYDPRNKEPGPQVVEVLGQFRSISIVEPRSPFLTLVSAVRSALENRRRQYALRDLIEEREKTARRYDLLSEIADQLLNSKSSTAIFEEVLHTVAGHLQLDVVFAYSITPGTGAGLLHPVVGLSKVQHAFLERDAGENIKALLSALGSCEPPRRDSRAARILDRLRVRSACCFPLNAQHRQIGTVFFGNRGRNVLRGDETSLLKAAADQMAVALERIRAEEELQRLNLDLERRVRDRTAQLQENTDQMEAFCYSISHDLRAPLRTIRGFSQALVEDYSARLDPLAQDYLHRVASGAERMDRLISDILEYSRLGRSELGPETVQLSTLVGNVTSQFEIEIKNKRASIQIQEPLPAVRGHAPTLEQVLSNLLSNALKFVAPSVRPIIRIFAEEFDSRVRIWVCDNGIGIAPEHRARIFRVFERLHGSETFPGTGIGLAIVAKAITRMDGTFGIESEPGSGSRFWFELPKAGADARA